MRSVNCHFNSISILTVYIKNQYFSGSNTRIYSNTNESIYLTYKIQLQFTAMKADVNQIFLNVILCWKETEFINVGLYQKHMNDSIQGV